MLVCDDAFRQRQCLIFVLKYNYYEVKTTQQNVCSIKFECK